eukprot:TRINITY_DN8220_c0_g1_i1.p1 TRINITY_DN8220_c0_g1~~TRINITY_DN8220_c0_g1_i1.p1  ORF type:complete len:104 (+),score=3.33 TRINITY_DN8220_c0_g1_i1:144-455(+)
MRWLCSTDISDAIPQSAICSMQFRQCGMFTSFGCIVSDTSMSAAALSIAIIASPHYTFLPLFFLILRANERDNTTPDFPRTYSYDFPLGKWNNEESSFCFVMF